MPEPYGIETAGSFGVGDTYIIVNVGNTNFTSIGAAANRVGVVFEATGAGSGTGTARRLNSQLGRIGGKLLADNLLRDGIDLAIKNTAYDSPTLYLKVNPEIADTVSAGNFVLGIRYKIRTVGTTNFLLIGSTSNTVGTVFTATAPGSGSGTADRISDVLGDTDGADELDPTPNQGSGSAVGFATDTPAYDLDINNDAKTTNVEATNQAIISNIIINSSGFVSTTVGPLYVSPSGHDPIIFHDRLSTDDLFFTDNIIGSIHNSNIEINPSGSGIIDLQSTVNISTDLNISGSVTMAGNLNTPSSISFGDSTFTAPSTGDTLDFNTFISQDLNPGIDNEFNLGMPNNKWGDLWAPDWTNIGNLRPSRMRISDQQILDGVAMEIRSLQSNDDLVLNPATGVLYVEELKLETQLPGLILTPTTISNPNTFGGSTTDWFGISADTSDDYLIVGARFEQSAGTFAGAAYIFDINTGNLLQSLANPNPFGTGNSDYFEVVAIDGDRCIVGAPQEDDAGGTSSGKAYIFDVTDGSLLFTLDNPNPFGTSASDSFGIAVDISGNRCIVGAPGEDYIGGNNFGRVYIYDVDTGSLLLTLDNPVVSGSSADGFGTSVAMCESYIIVGAPFANDGTGSNQGKAYIYDFDTGSLLFTLDNPNAFAATTSNDNFGTKVDICESYAIVSAPQEDTDATTPGLNNGKAYIFSTADGSLLHTLDWPGSVQPQNQARFGNSVSITESWAVVGCSEQDTSPTVLQDGKAYVYSTSTGSLLYTLDNPNPPGNDRFGYAVSITETHLVSTAYGNSSLAGTAYLYEFGSETNVITNLNTSSPVQFASTGAGYLRFMGTNAVLIPAGDNSTRPSSPEIGDTRWNTDLQYLECFDGTIYIKATGGGEEITIDLMEELGNLYSLILG